MKRLDQLTVTRFVVLLLVMYSHGLTGNYIPQTNNPVLSAFFRIAPTGVGYFYVLSGFVLSLIYFRPNEKFEMGKFWYARFVRIYPLYIISFLLTCFYYLESMSRIKPQKVLANLFILQAWIPAYSQSFNNVSWSLTVEIFFYAVFPFFVLWAYRQSTRKLITVSLIFWGISQIIYQVLWIGYFPEYRGFLLYFPLFHLNSFIVGVVGGIWYLRHAREENLKSTTVLLVLGISVLIVVGYTILGILYIPALPHDLQPMAGLVAPFLILIVVALALDKTRLSTWVLNRPLLMNLGEASYAIYILHVPIAWIYERALENSLSADPRATFDLTFFPMIITIGLVSHFYVDQPLRVWLKKILQRVSMPLLILDLVMIAISIIVSFRFRFGDGREYLSYRSMGLVMFWLAFFLRTMLSIVFNGFNPASLYGTLMQFVRPLVISTTISSAILFSFIFVGYSIGWFENFPRSIFIIEWAIMLSLSILVRYLFKLAGVYARKPL